MLYLPLIPIRIFYELMKNLFKTSLHMKQRTSSKCKVLTLLSCLLFFSFSSFAQQSIRGMISDDKGNPLPGATVQVKGTNKRAASDQSGNFTISVPAADAKLIVTNVGFKTLEVSVAGKNELVIVLTESASELNQVVVTGVFDKRKRLDASVAITTINAEQIKAQVPASAADLLKNVPGVYVNSSTGEIRNIVSTRGTPVSNTAAAGLQYVSLQEDGLPVVNVSGNNYGADYFLRADATIARVEAVRGGSASITGSDAPGGLFNYVSKTGGRTFQGEVRLKYGLEGDDNPFYRTDFNMGGPLNNKGDWTYNIGGFYRYSNGARYAGYALNNGGQVKGNIVKKLKNGSLKLYGKLLNDRNGFFDFLPFIDYEHPQIAPGFKNTNTFAGPGNQAFDFKYYPGDKTRHFDPKDLIHSQDRAIGLEWQQNLGKGWSITNNIRYSNKHSKWNMVLPLGVLSGDDLTPYVIIGALNFTGGPSRFGTYNFTDLTTGKTALTTQLSQNYTATIIDNKLPNNQVQSAPMLFQLGWAQDNKVKEVIDQLSISKKIGKTTLTAGAYFGHSDINFLTGYGGVSLMTLENNPHPLGVTATDAGGNTYQYTNSQGFLSTGSTFTGNNLTNNRFDVFFGQTTPLTSKLTLDYGFRLNNSQYKGSSHGAVREDAASNAGGYDKNTATLYDNTVNNKSAPWTYNYKFQDFSFSGALNYKISDLQAIYGRFSKGQKSPDLGYVTIPTSQREANELVLEPIKVTQIEVGYKFQTDKLTGFVTPFYSAVSNLSYFATGRDTNQLIYYTPNVFSKQWTLGVELEGYYDITPHFNIRAVGTIQNSKSPIARSWDLGQNGRQDDKVLEKTDQAAPLSPNLMATVTPTYRSNKFNTFLSWRYMGKRPANALKAFDLPSFSQFDFGLGYQLTKGLSATINVNNLFNSAGVMNWAPEGGFPRGNPENFTPEQRSAKPNAIWSAITIQPRSYYLTLAYNF
jgi:iron complex outermembrane recepter protein